VLSKNPIQDDLIWKARLDYLPLALCILGSVWMVRIFAPTNVLEPSSASTVHLMIKRIIIQCIALVGIIGFIAVLFHSIAETGLLKNPVAVAEVTRRYYAVNVPEISLDEMKTLVEQNRSLLFDTRFRLDFAFGAIPHAVNLSIDSGLAERKSILQGIDKSAKIVLYCQSSRCGFSDEVASFLKFNGYRNVSIFRGGYREWAIEHSL
jgi:rhodanese-related sulfurtransferase